MNFTGVNWIEKTLWENAFAKGAFEQSPFFIFNKTKEFVGFNPNQSDFPFSRVIPFLGQKINDFIRVFEQEVAGFNLVWNKVLDGLVHKLEFTLIDDNNTKYTGVFLPRESGTNMVQQVYLVFKNEIIEEEAQQPKDNQSEFAETQKRFLMIEDQNGQIINLFKQMRSSGLDACLAPTGDVALMMADVLKPDVIIADFNLKGKMDGINFCLKWQESHDTPVYFYSAQEEEIFALVGAEMELAYQYV
jgi:hypothetical protein